MSFFIWTMKDYCLIEVKANKILQGEIITKSTVLFQNVILLELLSKYFIENKNHSLGKDKDNMISSDNKNCKIIWFHQKCVKIEQIPNGNWYCSECKKLNKNRKNIRYLISPFSANIPFLYSQKISENHRFQGEPKVMLSESSCRNETLVQNRLRGKTFKGKNKMNT